MSEQSEQTTTEHTTDQEHVIERGSNGIKPIPEISVEPQAATLEDLFRKKAVTRRLNIVLTDPDGIPREYYLVFKMLDPERYEELLDQHPPRPKDKKAGLGHNPDEFSLSLIAEAMVTPMITREHLVQLKESGEWSRGELAQMYSKAIEASNGGLEVPFTSSA